MSTYPAYAPGTFAATNNAPDSQKQVQGPQGKTPKPVVIRGRTDPRAYHSRGDIETLDYLQAKLGDDGFESYLVGVIHTRLHRAMTLEGRDRRQDLVAADFYFGRLVQHIALVDGLGVDTPTVEGLPARLSQLSLAAGSAPQQGNDATPAGPGAVSDVATSATPAPVAPPPPRSLF